MKRPTTLYAVLAAMLAALLAPAGAFAVEKAGDVVYLRGKASIERAGKRTNARVRAALLESDSVRTRQRSRVKMLFRDDSILTLGPNSRLVVRKYLYNPDSKRAESIYELADGRMRAVVGSPGFKVVTPTAFAAARGTVFTVSYDAETGTTTITVLEGAVEVRNANADIAGSQVVTAGQSTTVSSGQPPAVPQTATPQPDEGGTEIEVAGGEGGGEDTGLLKELNEAAREGGIEPPIEQEPLHASSRVAIGVAFPR